MSVIAPQFVSQLPPDPGADRRRRLVLWCVTVLSVLGLAGAVFLAVAAVSTGGIAGCGGKGSLFDCSRVLHSRWAKWLSIPVGFPAALVYFGILATSLITNLAASDRVRAGAWSILVVLAVSAAGSGVWFIALQLFVIERFCLYCMAVHSCSIVIGVGVAMAWRRPLAPGVLLVLAGGVGVAVLAVGQVLVTDDEATHVLVDIDPDGEKRVVITSGDLDRKLFDENLPSTRMVDAPKDGAQTTISAPNDRPDTRMVSMLNDVVQIDAAARPVLGSVDAEYVIVELFDYTCHHCRELHELLTEAKKRYGDQLAIVVVVVPVNPSCNRLVRGLHPDHKHACEIARMGMAVWRVSPEKYEQFHEYTMGAIESRTLGQARKRAVELIGADALKREKDDPNTNRMIEQNVSVYKSCGGGPIPKLLLPEKLMLGIPKTPEDLFEVLEEQLGIEPVAE